MNGRAATRAALTVGFKMTVLVVAGLVLVFLLLGLGGWAVGLYNALVALRNQVEQAWSNIDVLLKQRRDELTKAIEVVKGVKNFEQETLMKVTEARAKAGTAAGAAGAGAAMAESAAIRGFFAVAESYPELKSNQNFLNLQERIGAIEGQIADRRELYNDSVNLFNTRIEQFPDNIAAGILGYRRYEYFKATEEEKADVKIQF